MKGYSEHRNLWHVTCDIVIEGGMGPGTTRNLFWELKRSFEKVFYKVLLTLLQSATALFITKCDGGVLQSAAAILLQCVIEVITKRNNYYKVRQYARAFPAKCANDRLSWFTFRFAKRTVYEVGIVLRNDRWPNAMVSAPSGCKACVYKAPRVIDNYCESAVIHKV